MVNVLRIVLAAIFFTSPAQADPKPPLISDEAAAQWTAIGRVNVGGFNSRGLCTGTLIAPDKVLTAAHCIVDRKNNTTFSPDRIRFVAGWHKGGHQGSAKAISVTTHPDYMFQPPTAAAASFLNFAVDMAVITLSQPLTPPPHLLGMRNQGLGPVEMLGYRADRPHALSQYNGCVALDLGLSGFGLSCDVASGTSGAPVFLGEKLVGVVTARLTKLSAKAFVAAVDDWVLSGVE